MGVCIYPNSVCQDKAAAVNVHRSVGLNGNLSSSLNEHKTKNKITPDYHVKEIGYKIKINLIFFCNKEILKNSFTYKFQLFIDSSDMEEENFISLGSTEATICQSQIKFNKIFETYYFFSKGQRIKICCLENEKNINTSLFYLGKMINGFENPKLLIEKDNEKIGELLILINNENNIKNKKCVFFVEISNKTKFSDKSDFFFTINKNSGETIYISEIFNSENNFEDKPFRFYYQIRKHIIFDKSKYIIINLYKIKEIARNESQEQNQLNNDKEIKDIENPQKRENEITLLENELIDTIHISYNELLKNNGINLFTMNKGLLSYFRNESVQMQIYFNEKDYTSFFDFISCQLHLNLLLIVNKEILIKYNSGIKYIMNKFHSLISFYNNDEQTFIYLKNKEIKKNNNYQDFYDDIANDEKEVTESKEIFPDIDYICDNYINPEMSKRINKYFIFLIFTDQKFNDLNSDINYNLKIHLPNYDIYNNSPMNIKIFNFGDKSNYIEKNDININIYKNINDDIKYNRIIFQFYNVNNENNDKKQLSKYLCDIPYLIEDFYEIQKMAKFSIFDD